MQTIMLPLDRPLVVGGIAAVEVSLIQNRLDQLRCPASAPSFRSGTGLFGLKIRTFCGYVFQQLSAHHLNPLWTGEHLRDAVRALRRAVALAGHRAVCL